MKNRENEIREAFDMFTAAWRFYKEHWDVTREDFFWEPVIQISENMYKEHDSMLLRDLLGVVVKDMERRMKER